MTLEAVINRAVPGVGTPIMTRGLIDGTKRFMDYSVNITEK